MSDAAARLRELADIPPGTLQVKHADEIAALLPSVLARVAALEKWADYLKMLSADLEDRVAALEAALREALPLIEGYGSMWAEAPPGSGHNHDPFLAVRIDALLADALPPVGDGCE